MINPMWQSVVAEASKRKVGADSARAAVRRLEVLKEPGLDPVVQEVRTEGALHTYLHIGMTPEEIEIIALAEAESLKVMNARSQETPVREPTRDA